MSVRQMVDPVSFGVGYYHNQIGSFRFHDYSIAGPNPLVK
jgi:hypothetical protein